MQWCAEWESNPQIPGSKPDEFAIPLSAHEFWCLERGLNPQGVLLLEQATLPICPPRRVVQLAGFEPA